MFIVYSAYSILRVSCLGLQEFSHDFWNVFKRKKEKIYSSHIIKSNLMIKMWKCHFPMQFKSNTKLFVVFFLLLPLLQSIIHNIDLALSSRWMPFLRQLRSVWNLRQHRSVRNINKIVLKKALSNHA